MFTDLSTGTNQAHHCRALTLQLLHLEMMYSQSCKIQGVLISQQLHVVMSRALDRPSANIYIKESAVYLTRLAAATNGKTRHDQFLFTLLL
jgi:hypothetical protein